MDAGKVPVKLVKVTRVLGRTGKRPRNKSPPSRPGAAQDNTDLDGSTQVREVVSHKSELNSWTTQAEASFETSRDQV